MSGRVDNKTGAMEIVPHLIGHGHRRIAIIKGRDQNVDAQERLKGYRTALRRSGCEVSRALELAGNCDESSGHDAAPELLRLHPRLTAVFASNDAMAVGAMSVLLDAGVKIPEQMALAGFDDTPIAQYLTPSLTSIHVALSDLGELAMQRIMRIVKDGCQHNNEQTILSTTTVIRQSCGCHQ